MISNHRMHVWSLACDIQGLAKALDHIVDRPDQPGMQAVLNCLLDRAGAMETALDGPELWADPKPGEAA